MDICITESKKVAFFHALPLCILSDTHTQKQRGWWDKLKESKSQCQQAQIQQRRKLDMSKGIGQEVSSRRYNNRSEPQSRKQAQLKEEEERSIFQIDK